MAKSNASQTAVAILGMHRSGTSLITRVVNLLGAYLGEEDDLMEARPDNPEGFWEHRLVYDFHERLLHALSRNWDTVIPLAPDWHKSPEIAPFRDELAMLIEKQFAGRALWAWKDPRTCILLPLWIEVLAELNVELHCLLVTRNPLDVARSLKVRDGFSLDESFGLWFNHNLAMLQNSTGLPRAVVSYQGFLADPVASIASWASGLSLRWPRQNEELPDLLRQVVRKDLCHSASNLSDLKKTGCPKPVVELAGILDALEKKGDKEELAEATKIERLLEDHWLLSKLYSHDFSRELSAGQKLHEQLAEQQKVIIAAHSKKSEQEKQIVELRSQLLQKDKELTTAQAHGESVERKFAEREQALAAAEEKRETLQRQLQDRERVLLDTQSRFDVKEREFEKVRAHLSDITKSYTWRITWPLRKARTIFKSVFGN